MEKEFVPYAPSLRLKELGFDEPCFGYYKYDELIIEGRYKNSDHGFSISAPTFSQAFRWFREKYDLVSWVRRRPGFVKEYSWYISDFNDEDPDEYYFDLHIETYEEAELACLIKLLEIVESEKN